MKLEIVSRRCESGRRSTTKNRLRRTSSLILASVVRCSDQKAAAVSGFQLVRPRRVGGRPGKNPQRQKECLNHPATGRDRLRVEEAFNGWPPGSERAVIFWVDVHCVITPAASRKEVCELELVDATPSKESIHQYFPQECGLAQGRVFASALLLKKEQPSVSVVFSSYATQAYSGHDSNVAGLALLAWSNRIDPRLYVPAEFWSVTRKMTHHERRQYSRKTLNPLPYIHLPSGNGGLVLDISEQGLRFRASSPVEQTGPINFSFTVHSNVVAGIGELVWFDHAKRTGGLRYTQLPYNALEQIRKMATEPEPATGHHPRLDLAHPCTGQPAARPRPARRTRHVQIEGSC